MQVFRSLSEWRAFHSEFRKQPSSLGLVPTMGYLHEGHLSLVRAAKAQNSHVVVSIYVNPIQFVPGEDLDTYPRDEERDLDLLKQEGIDFVLVPTSEDMYPEGYSTYIPPPAAGEGWCGVSRPGHFQGVCTVVSILFNLVQPQRAYFGRKDAQQAAVIRSLVQDLQFPVEIVVCPIVREKDGLAMSSRNVYLSQEERKKALVLSQTLGLGLTRYQEGISEAKTILSEGISCIHKMDGVRLDYLGIVDQNTFKSVESIQPGTYYIGAIYVGTTRLIDNMVFGSREGLSCNELC